MNDIQKLAQIYEFLFQGDANIRVPAENQLFEFRKVNLNGFIQTNLIILQNPANFKPQVVHSALLYTRISFSNATKAKQSNDITNQYLLIPLEITNAFLPIIFPLLTNQTVSDYTAKLLGQIASYILSFDPENQIVSLICQQLTNTNTSIACCTAIEYILEEIDLSLQLQSIILQQVIPLLSNNEFPNEIKSKLISVLTSMISSLPNFFTNANSCASFAQSMLALTSIVPLKIAAYNFWDDAASSLPSIFEFIPKLFELCYNDLRIFSNKGDQNNNTDITNTILSFLCDLSNYELDNPDSLSKVLIPVIPVFFPLFLAIYQQIENPNELDMNDDWDPRIASQDCIRSFAASFPSQAIPILIKFSQEAISNFNANHSMVLVETYLFCFSVIIDSSIDEDEESQNTMNIKNIATQCIQQIFQFIQNKSTPIRVTSQALKLLLSIIQNKSTKQLISCLEQNQVILLIDFILGYMQNIQNSLCEDAKNVLSEIIPLINNIQTSSQIFDKLLKFDNVPSLDCAKQVLKGQPSPEFARYFLPKLIALADIYYKNLLARSPNQQACHELFPFVIQMIVILVDRLKQEAIPFFRVLFGMMQETFTQFGYPEALMAICSIVSITNHNVQYAVNLVLIQLNNSISAENQQNQVIESNYGMRSAAVSSISLYLSKCDIQQYFHGLMIILLKLLETQQNNSDLQLLNSSLKVEILEAINSLHCSFPLLMKPFLVQIIQIFGFALNSVPMIVEEDEEISVEMITAILEGIKLILASGVGDLTPNIIQMALHAIQCASSSECMSKDCVAELVDLLNLMLKLIPNETKQFVSSNENLKQILEEAKQIPELSDSIQKLMALLC